MRILLSFLSGIAIFGFYLTVQAKAELQNQDLVVYSTRKEQLLEPLLNAYAKETGRKVKVVYDSEGPLLERLAREGQDSPADVLIVVDAGNLWKAGDMGLLAPVQSKVLETNIPAHLRDPEGRWFALTRRVRAIVYNPNKVKLEDLSTYEDLSSPKWKGKLCLRSSTKVYNQSLVAMMIERLGEDETKKVVQGWVNNLGAKVFADDTSLIKALKNGPCQVGIVNSYYLGRLLKDDPEFPAKLFWPNQKTSGAHVNISGAGVTASSKNKRQAQEFIEWMTRPLAQSILSDMNLEFPVKDVVAKDLNPILKDFGPFKADTLNLSIAGQRQRQAVMLMDAVGYQ